MYCLVKNKEEPDYWLLVHPFGDMYIAYYGYYVDYEMENIPLSDTHGIWKLVVSEELVLWGD